MAKAANKPKINTLKGDRAALADKAYGERAPKPKAEAPKAKPKAASKPQFRVPASGLRKPAVKGAAPAKQAASLGDKLKSYLKNSTSQIKSGLKDLRVNPKETLKRAAKSLPQGRSARLAIGALAGAGAAYTAGGMVDKAVASNKKSAAEKQKAYAAARDDVPSVPAAAKKDTPKEAAKPAPQASAKASTSKATGGKYPVYNKNSSQAASFRAAFADARKAGKKEFTWEGRKYNTKVKGE